MMTIDPFEAWEWPKEWALKLVQAYAMCCAKRLYSAHRNCLNLQRKTMAKVPISDEGLEANFERVMLCLSFCVESHSKSLCLESFANSLLVCCLEMLVRLQLRPSVTNSLTDECSADGYFDNFVVNVGAEVVVIDFAGPEFED